MRQLEGCCDQQGIVLVEICRQELLGRQGDDSSGTAAVTGMGSGTPLLEDETSAGLPLARQGANLAEQHKVSAALAQAGPRSDVAGRDDQPAPLEIADGRAGRSPDHELSGRQAATGAISDAASANHGQARRIQLGGQLGAGVAFNLDEGLPGPGDLRDQ